MMQYRQVKKYADMIRECYASDQALIEKFHIVAGTDLDTCVQNSLAVLTDPTHKVKVYEVLEKGERVGYFGAINTPKRHYLDTFFVMPKYRTPPSLTTYWKVILKYFKQQSFTTGIYAKNTRAESFLLRGGCKLWKDLVIDGEQVKVFIYQN